MQKNKLNLLIYGIHLLNPYKTVVSHLKLHSLSARLASNYVWLSTRLRRDLESTQIIETIRKLCFNSSCVSLAGTRTLRARLGLIFMSNVPSRFQRIMDSHRRDISVHCRASNRCHTCCYAVRILTSVHHQRIWHVRFEHDRVGCNQKNAIGNTLLMTKE